MPAPAILPFLPLIGQAVGQGIRAIGGARRAKAEEGFYKDLQTSGEQQAKELTQKREGLYEVGPTMRKYLQYAMQDPAADLERQEAQRQSGMAVGALKAGGARAILGGLGAQQQQAATNMARIAADEQARKTGALSTYGRVEENLRGRQLSDVGADLDTAREQAASGLRGAFMADQYRRSMGTEALAGLAGLAGQAAGMGAFGDGTGGGSAAENFNNADPATQAWFMDPENQAMLNAARFAFERGGKVKKTPGEFSHATNPISVMKDGAKIGELTGGEYVLNPEQAKAIAKQSDIARRLFKKFDREA
jgi:hypothetical protein